MEKIQVYLPLELHNNLKTIQEFKDQFSKILITLAASYIRDPLHEQMDIPPQDRAEVAFFLETVEDLIRQNGAV